MFKVGERQDMGPSPRIRSTIHSRDDLASHNHAWATRSWTPNNSLKLTRRAGPPGALVLPAVKA